MPSRRILAALALSLAAGAAQPAAAAAPASREVFVQTAPGVRIHAIVAGTGGGKPTLVLIPGWRLTASVWREQIAAFSGDRQVIAIDPRSEGASTKTGDDDTPEGRAGDLRAVLRRLGVRDAVLVGWSQGVQDVAAYVDRFGVDGVSGVVLVDATISEGVAGAAKDPASATRTLRQIDRYLHDPRAQTEGLMHAIIRKPLGRPAFDALVADALKTPPAIGAAMLVDDLLGPDRSAAITKMRVPVLVIASASSFEVDGQRTMAAHAPCGRFEAVENAGHAVFIDQPARFDALLQDFLHGAVGHACAGAP